MNLFKELSICCINYIFVATLLLSPTACTQVDAKSTPIPIPEPTFTPEPTPIVRVYYPLEKGAKWVYEGTVKWQVEAEVFSRPQYTLRYGFVPRPTQDAAVY